MILSIILFLFALVIVRHLFFWKAMDVSHLYKSGIMLVGHRGSPKEEPENTLPSYKRAVEAGLKAVEIDVVTTLNGVIVCSHNHDLERETDGFGYIHELDYEAIKSINAGVKFDRDPVVVLPLLEDVIQELPDSVVINIEIKNVNGFDQKPVKPVVDLIRKYNLYHRVIVSSFHPFSIGLVKFLDKRIPTAYLWDNEQVPDILKNPWLINLVHPDIFHPAVHLVSNDVLNLCRRKGMKMNVWTVNNLPSMKWLLQLGVDGIISDFHHLMIEAVKVKKTTFDDED